MTGSEIIFFFTAGASPCAGSQRLQTAGGQERRPPGHATGKAVPYSRAAATQGVAAAGRGGRELPPRDAL